MTEISPCGILYLGPSLSSELCGVTGHSNPDAAPSFPRGSCLGGLMDRKILSVRHYKAGYEVREERVQVGEDDTVTMKSAYTPDGHYIGDSKRAHRLIVKRGIKPELAPGCTVCSIGFCEKDQRWAGWSHRALCSFGIGDRIFEQEYGNDQTPFVEHGRILIENLGQAKKAAIAFAEHVS